jgi:nuclear pore complex protein Nup155
VEALNFVQVLVDRGLSEVVSSLPRHDKDSLVTLTYEGLVTQPLGRDLVRNLITCMINRDIREHREVDHIAQELRRRCPSFFSADELLLHKAKESLERARRLPPGDEQETELQFSLVNFKKVVRIIDLETLASMMEKYMDPHLRRHPAAADLALACAAHLKREADELDVAQVMEDEMVSEWVVNRKSIFQKVIGVVDNVDKLVDLVQANGNAFGEGSERISRCCLCVGQFDIDVDFGNVADRYFRLTFPTLVVEALRGAEALRNAVMDVCLSSEDEEFHRDLYNWLAWKGRDNELIDVSSEEGNALEW